MSTYASVGFSSFVDLDGTPAVALGRARSQLSGPRTVRGNNSKLATVIFKIIRTESSIQCDAVPAPHLIQIPDFYVAGEAFRLQMRRNRSVCVLGKFRSSKFGNEIDWS